MNKSTFLKRSSMVALFGAALLVGCSTTTPIYDPECGEGYYILTPEVGAEPRFNGAETFGVRPGAPFLHSLAVTGERPMTFAAENLPEGLTLDCTTGEITGKIADLTPKSYTVNLTAKNGKGAAERTLEIIVGEDICLTPPMGWSSWICFKKTVSQQGVLDNAKAMKKLGLDQYGYTYVNIDDAWQGPARGGEFNAIQPNLETFPDIQQLSDDVHAMGFKFGIYSTPWITSYAKFVGGSSNNKDGYWDESMIYDATNAGVEGSASKMGKYRFDDNDAKQWAAWDVDYMKYDWNPNDSASIVNMAVALRNSGRDIAFSVSNSCPLSEAMRCKDYVQVFRTGGDIRARWTADREHLNLWENWNNHINWLENGYEGGPGHTPDADFLMVGLQEYGADEKLTVDEIYHHVSSFVLWGSSLLLSCPLDQLTDFELSMIKNVEMLDINQDRLSLPAQRVYKDGGIEVLVKELANGERAIGIFNFNDEATVANFDLSYAGLSGKVEFRDVWRQQNIGTYKDVFSANIRPHGCVVVRTQN